MKITAERGRGYRPAEENKRDDQPIGVIPVDSIFTPVTSKLPSGKYPCRSKYRL